MVERLTCKKNQLESLDLPFANYVDCRNNLIQYITGPRIISIWCGRNQLSELDLPKAIYIKCMNNILEYIIANNCIELICDYNPHLEYIFAPKLKDISYDINNQIGTLINVEADGAFNIYKGCDVCIASRFKLSEAFTKETLESIAAMCSQTSKSARNL